MLEQVDISRIKLSFCMVCDESKTGTDEFMGLTVKSQFSRVTWK